MKFRLTRDGAPTCQLPPAAISLFRTVGGPLGAINQSEFLQPSDAGSNFRIDVADCHYSYNLGTSSLGPATYLVQITINGSIVGSGTFALR